MRLVRYDESAPSKEQRGEFDCGEASLNNWLATQAGQSMKSRDAVTYLLLDDHRIAGYFCISAGSVAKESAPAELTRRAPNPIPVIVMGRFAIDVEYQGQGLGADLLAHAVRRALNAAEHIGARALLVDALTESALGFWTACGFRPSPVHRLQLMISLNVAKASLAAAH